MNKLLEFAKGKTINEASVLFVVSRGEDGSLVSTSGGFIPGDHNILIVEKGIVLTPEERKRLIQQTIKNLRNEQTTSICNG